MVGKGVNVNLGETLKPVVPCKCKCEFEIDLESRQTGLNFILFVLENYRTFPVNRLIVYLVKF